MLPPSPQHYQHRYSQPPPPPPSLLNQSYSHHADLPSPAPAPKRPGSSMSISAMLGSDTDRLLRDPPSSGFSSQYHTNSTGHLPLATLMSPPQQGPRTSIAAYPYQPRSQTPDRQNQSHTLGPRQYRSSSGTMMQRPPTFEDPRPPPVSSFLQSFGSSQQPPPLPVAHTWGEEAADRARRTSLSGILQRPNSQPQTAGPLPDPSLPHNSRWDEPPMLGGDRAPLHEQRPVGKGEAHPSISDIHMSGFSASNGAGSYDTRPPPLGGPRLSSLLPDSELNTSLKIEQRPSQPVSPERQRSVMDTNGQSAFGTLVNGPPNAAQNESQAMARQESSQSQSDRLVPQLLGVGPG